MFGILELDASRALLQRRLIEAGINARETLLHVWALPETRFFLHEDRIKKSLRELDAEMRQPLRVCEGPSVIM